MRSSASHAVPSTRVRAKSALRCGILTVSDRASRGEYADETGPRLRGLLESKGWSVERARVSPDETFSLRAVVQKWAEEGLDVIIAAGGTGISPRDVTPEALKPLLDKELPGFGELMRAGGMKTTKKAALSRSFAGTRGTTLVLAVPGSPRGAAESVEAVAELIPAAVSLLKGGACA
jgi:molybdopterin adenylyltransferase